MCRKKIDEAIRANDDPLRAISEIDIPTSLLGELDTELVLLLRVDSKVQKLSKYLTKALLVGVASSSLTGGLVVVPSG